MSYTDIDFERHPMPASTRARIRDRMAGLRGAVAARQQASIRGTLADAVGQRDERDLPGLPHHQTLPGDDA